jgi:hypothetical protein
MTSRSWSLVVVALIVGCTAAADETNVADGLACHSSDACVSKKCESGYCAGRSCKTADPASCEPGWRCTEFSGGILSSGSVECVPLCGKCPGNQHCPAGGEVGATPCEDGAPRKVTITGPTTVMVNTEVTFAVTVDPPFMEITSVDWTVGEKAGQGQSFGPGMPTTTTKLDVNMEVDLFVTAVVHGKMGANQFATAEGVLPIHHACLADGAVCDADGEGRDAQQICCAKGLYCPGQTGSNAPQHCAPLK